MKKCSKSEKLILWFDEIGIEDVSFVGGKNASLGEMFSSLSKRGVKVPNGFAVTAEAYRLVLNNNGAFKKLKSVLRNVNTKNFNNLNSVGRKCREIILDCEFPDVLIKEISKAYKKLCSISKVKDLDVAVRSSATAEDLPSASFAGQQETFLNIKGVNSLIDSVKKCFASLFTNRAIAYRVEHKFDHLNVYLSVCVQRMVRSDLASSGVMFTVDTESGFKDVIFITGSYGLGESVVQGLVNPDEFYVFKPTLKKGFDSLIRKNIGSKDIKIIYSNEGTKTVKQVPVFKADSEKFCLSDSEVLKLAEWGVIIEEFYSKKSSKWTPMDIEWAKDGRNGEIFIVQARPETVQSQKQVNFIEEYSLLQKGDVICEGRSVGSKIGQGVAKVIKDINDINNFKEGEILVTEMTDPDWVPAMRIASAIVTNKGGRTSHAAIVSRELGLPCVVGCEDATEKIKNGQKITVSCAEGDVGFIYDKLLKFKIQKFSLKNIPDTKTKILMNIGNPDTAFELSFLPNDGVGLAREEFIINNYIKIHPLALINFDKIKNKNIREEIDKITKGYKNKADFFVERLSMGIAMIAAAFYPKPVILRFSDFKSNEYRNLIGGEEFEPTEQNPMIGWRGASRYYSSSYKPAFALECKAVKKVRDFFGLDNLKVMIPMCRTVDEGKNVLKVMEENNLKKGKDGLEVFVMCEIPSNVVLADEFCKVFDGFSIGSNDLTQLVLGVDRDSEIISSIFDEKNPAVLKMIEHVIRVAKKHKKKIGICGDAPSTHKEFVDFLIHCGIDSISLSPDAILKVRLEVADFEKKK
jgi:pyruvate, water dikinase